MEEALIARLLSYGPTALVGQRINWLVRPEAEGLPAITAQVTDASTEYNHGGRSDLQYPHVQFDCWGKTYSDAKRVSRLLCFELEQRRDTPSVEFFEGIEIRNTDMPTETLPGGTKVFRVLLEYLLPHRMKGA